MPTELKTADLDKALAFLEANDGPVTPPDMLDDAILFALGDNDHPNSTSTAFYMLLRRMYDHLRVEEEHGHLPAGMLPGGKQLTDTEGRPIGTRSELQEEIFKAARFGVEELGARPSPESAEIVLEGLVGLTSEEGAEMGPAEIVLRICERLYEALEQIPPAVELKPSQRARMLLEEAASIARTQKDAMALIAVAEAVVR